VTLIADPDLDKDEIVRVPTIYDVAKGAGLRTAAIRWPASRNAKTLDWQVPDMKLGEPTERYATPALMAEAKAAGVWFGGRSADLAGVEMFNMILREHRPNVGLLHVADLDHMEHLNGPRSPEAYAAIKEADRQVGMVWETLKREYPGKATLVIVSDHGFSPIERAILPNVILREAGLVDVKGVRVVGGAVTVVIQGGSAMLYVLDRENRDAVIGRVRKAFDGAKGVAKVVGPDGLKEYGVGDAEKDPHAPDMMLFAMEGWTFGDTAAGVLPFVDKPERSGTHGHDPMLPNLHATFVAWGAGIRPGSRVGEVRNTDVAPTMARVLGLEMKDVDGKVLRGILAE
jgi:predicted AlkP superfamily pyrophosphatase or phosphodiesterase